MRSEFSGIDDWIFVWFCFSFFGPSADGGAAEGGGAAAADGEITATPAEWNFIQDNLMLQSLASATSADAAAAAAAAPPPPPQPPLTDEQRRGKEIFDRVTRRHSSLGSFEGRFAPC